MSEYQVWVLDGANKVLKVAEKLNAVDVVLRYNNIGKWVVTLPYSAEMAGVLTDYDHQVRIVRNGTELIRGKISQYQRTYDKGKNKIQVNGNSPEEYLNRLALPVPGGPPYTSAAYDIRTGAAETIIKQYVNYNIGPSATLARRVSGLTIQADSGRGGTVTGRARFQALLGVIQDLAMRGGVGFRIHDMEFQIYTGTDRTRKAVFSLERGNLAGFTYTRKRAEATYIYCGGSGTGTGRTIAEMGNSAAILTNGRWEKFLNRGQTNVSSELADAMQNELEKTGEQVELSATPIQIDGMRALDDYGLGDQVTMIIDGEPVGALVREIGVKYNSKGEDITPVIGSWQARGGRLLALLKTDQIERIETLEVV